jgi:DNA-binding CsgD family transcriptional regulator
MQTENQFSERERDVIGLLLQGKTNKQMALALGISVRAIEFHLSNIYGKLGVNSRTEAALKLSAGGLRVSTGGEIRESSVTGMDESIDNDTHPVPRRRLPMKNLILAGIVLLATTLVIVLALNGPARQNALPAPTSTIFIASPVATVTEAVTPSPQPTISARVHILEELRQAVAEYEQSVQAEKKNGSVEFGKDPVSGAEVFHFKDESYMRLMALNEKLNDKINQLDALYAQVYRDELNPTPFPTQASPEQNKTYYDATLAEFGDQFCSQAAVEQYPGAETVQMYDLDQGNYRTVYLGDSLARCEVFGQMLEEFRVAPILAKVNKERDAAMIRQVTGKNTLILTFQAIRDLPNAPWQSGAAMYTDETGCKYYVDVESGRLIQIEPNIPSHPDVPAGKVKSIDELRGVARQFALTNSARLAALEPVLTYEEGGKTVIYFFTWTYRAKDWSGTDWAMMPPFLQVGVLADGQILTYINTLDLYK